MAGQVSLKVGHVSITGNFRDNNEDNCLIDSQARFFLVADGMGGQSAGEKASEMAIDLISERLLKKINFQNPPNESTISHIEEAVTFANNEIMVLGSTDSRHHNMGTTVTFIVHVAGQFFVGGVGFWLSYSFLVVYL
jgi:serine/threonine protein phosphatase PrpC